jgi:hypothetical protein
MAEEQVTLLERVTKGETLTPEERRQMWLEISPGITAEQFDGMADDRRTRQARVPEIGKLAPDFEIDVLDGQRRRTGEMVRLSALRGQPVALLFGSYT